MIDSKPVVLFIEGSDNGCNWYRIRQPALELMERENFAVGLSKSMSEDDLSLWIEKADIFYTQKTSSKYLKFLYEGKKDKIFVFDQDDDAFSVSPYNPGYSDFGIKEVDYILKDGSKFKLRDGENGFDIERNKMYLSHIKTTIKESHCVVTPSPILSGKFKKINPNTRVIKNLLSLDNWQPLPLIRDESVRIGYQCGWSHYEDFWEVRDALLYVLNKFPQAKLVIMGQAYAGALEGFPMDQVEFHSWVSMDGYPHKLKALGLDIGIAPLCNSQFNNCKSELKWEEYSALEIPTVASNVPPYSINIRDEHTGYLCSNEQEWKNILSILINSPEARVSTAKRARKEIELTYSLDTQIAHYEVLFKDLLKKNELVAI